MPRTPFKIAFLGSLIVLGPWCAGSTYVGTRVNALETHRAEPLSPHQRFVAEQIIKASRDYEGAPSDGTFTLWIKASLKDDDSILIKSITDLLWDTKSHVHLPLNPDLDKTKTVRKPRNAGSVLILNNPSTQAEIDRDFVRLDRILTSILEDGLFAVVVFVDDQNIFEKLNHALTAKLNVLDLKTKDTACETLVASAG